MSARALSIILVGIRVLDHVIIGGDGYMSFVDAGLCSAIKDLPIVIFNFQSKF